MSFLKLGGLISALRDARDLWELVSQLRNQIGYHGLYEILDYDATLALTDPQGTTARLQRRELIRFLQDHVVAIHDYAWGEGELFADYKVHPGTPVDFYEDGSKCNVLISLRETKNRGDVINLWVERTIKDGFLQGHEWLETEVDYLMHHLKLSIIFPAERHCQRATVTQRSTHETATLGPQHFTLMGDGRQQLIWETHRPQLRDRYTLKWDW